MKRLHTHILEKAHRRGGEISSRRTANQARIIDKVSLPDRKLYKLRIPWADPHFGSFTSRQSCLGRARGPARAAVVEHDDVALTDQDIQQRWVPMIDGATQAEDERNTRLGTDGR